MSGVELTGVAGWMATILATAGPPGVGLIILVENLFPPVPSEAVLPAAGFLAAQGEFGVVAAIVWATFGSVVGALVLYGAGRSIGDERMTALIDRVPLMSASDAERAWSAFDRFGFDELMPKTIANATVDRLMHHAHVVLTAGDSIRLTQATAGKGVTPLA